MENPGSIEPHINNSYMWIDKAFHPLIKYASESSTRSHRSLACGSQSYVEILRKTSRSQEIRSSDPATPRPRMS
jgi:hypothetical protein